MVILDNLLLQVSPPFLFCEMGALFLRFEWNNDCEVPGLRQDPTP